MRMDGKVMEENIMADNNNRKNYTFLNTQTVKTKNGGEAIGCTVVGYVSRVTAATSANAPVRAAIAINNRNKRLNNLLGTSFSEDEETVFADVAVWGDAGPRLVKYMEASGGKSVKAVLCGRISKNEFDTKTGEHVVGVRIDVNDWTSVDNRTSNGSSNNGASQQTAQQAPQQSAPQSVGQTSGFSQIDESEMDDGDCPF